MTSLEKLVGVILENPRYFRKGENMIIWSRQMEIHNKANQRVVLLTTHLLLHSQVMFGGLIPKNMVQG